jgi:TetR/AcrR family transcriptional regulator
MPDTGSRPKHSPNRRNSARSSATVASPKVRAPAHRPAPGSDSPGHPLQDAARDARESDSKEMVLNAAQSLIMQHGFTGLSMRELARHSGIAKGTIYHHFQDKREIYLHVLERDILFVRDRLLTIVKQEGSFADKLRALIHVYFDLQRERRLVIMAALRENAALDDQFSEIIKKYRSELLQPIGALIHEGIQNGEVCPIDVDLTVLSLLGILQGFVVHQLILEDTDIDETVVKHIVDLFAHGIMTSAGDATTTQRSQRAPARHTDSTKR